MSKTILIIDGDILCFRHAAAIETRTVDCLHIPSMRTKSFGTRTEFKEFLKSKNFEYKKEDYQITDQQSALGKELAFGSLKTAIDKMAFDLFVDEVRVYISGSNNFRDTLLLPSKYKGTREGNLRPLRLKDCREFLKKHYKATECNLFEADDAIVFMGYEELEKGDYPIIATIDKDFNSSSGLSVYRFTDETPKVHKISDLGFLKQTDKNKTVGEGFLWLCYQLVVGDATDAFKPSEVACVKFGDVAGYLLLHSCTSHKEALERVRDKYKEWYPDKVEYAAWNGSRVFTDYKGMLALYYKCVRMMQTKDDKLIVEELFKEYGVKL